jgi:predicted DNA-binding protein (MmcQ/YjbR family)
MRLDTLKRLGLSLPHTTVVKQWGDNLVFKIGGKIFLILSFDCELLEQAAFKVPPAEFKRLTDLDGIIPAPYLARASWVAVEDFAALPAAELERLIRESYALVFAGLPKKMRATLSALPPAQA